MIVKYHRFPFQLGAVHCPHEDIKRALSVAITVSYVFDDFPCGGGGWDRWAEGAARKDMAIQTRREEKYQGVDKNKLTLRC